MREISVWGFLLAAFIIIGKLLFDAVKEHDWPLLLVFSAWALVLLRAGLLYYFSMSVGEVRVSTLPGGLAWVATDWAFAVVSLFTMAGAIAFLFRDIFRPRLLVKYPKLQVLIKRRPKPRK